jgi:glycosyltransferase involved in cell wall biosynthesis
VAPCPAPGGSRRILIVSDAWRPQVNGVVRTLSTVVAELAAMGHVAEVLGPDRFRTLPCPTYPEIRLALRPGPRVARMIAAFAPDYLHIATEGPLGWAARGWARRHGRRFTSSFHTKFPDYVSARFGLPAAVTYRVLRRFHGAGSATMVVTESMRAELASHGFTDLVPWVRGVDLAQFRPAPRDPWEGMARPVLLYVGRVAVEKNLAAFLSLDMPGSKAVIGDGPQLAELKRQFPGAHFPGARFGEALARAFAGADVFVFPSRTDTFGLVLLEAMACGTPVAAYPVTGPRDILAGAPPGVGACDADLSRAVLTALAHGDRAACRAFAETFSWRACAEQFLGNLVPLGA